MADGSGRLETAGWQQAYRDRRFAILLGVLLTLLVVPSDLFGFAVPAAWFDRMLSLLVFVAILSHCVERHQRVFALLVGIPTILLSLGGQTLSGEGRFWVSFLGHVCAVLFLFGSAGIIVRSLFRPRALTFDGIFGAVCGYLFLGLGWATVYSMIEAFRPGSFEINESLLSAADPQPAHTSLLTHFSFVTLTTLGYGDVTPTSPLTQTLAWIEAITGQFYLAVVVAGLVTMLMAKSLSRTETVPDGVDLTSAKRTASSGD